MPIKNLIHAPITKEAVSEALKKLREKQKALAIEFEDLKAELDRRFGAKRALRSRKDPGDVFRAFAAPSGMTMPLMEALCQRKSARSFSNEPIPDPMLSNLLFAADGINRPNGKRTTPSALDRRETEIYVLKSNGVWRWVPERCGLIFCSPDDLRAETRFVEQPKLMLPPVEILYVANFERTRSVLTMLAEKFAERFSADGWTPEVIDEVRERSVAIAVGAKIQSVYLAAASMGLSTVAKTGFKREMLEESLRLKPAERIMASQSVGFPAKSFMDHIR